jgi:hypothetical protein
VALIGIVINTIRFGVCAVVKEDTTTGNPMVSPMVNATSKIGVWAFDIIPLGLVEDFVSRGY